MERPVFHLRGNCALSSVILAEQVVQEGRDFVAQLFTIVFLSDFHHLVDEAERFAKVFFEIVAELGLQAAVIFGFLTVVLDEGSDEGVAFFVRTAGIVKLGKLIGAYIEWEFVVREELLELVHDDDG